LITLSLAGAYWLQKSAIDHSVNQRVAGVARLFEKLIQEESQVMSGQIDFLKTEQALSDPFLASDRGSLIEAARPLFERMREKYRVTHFYFHGKDQICFLRVHSPGRHGDFIDRFTMKGAVSTGQPFYGIELGPLGTFTLRVVHPWAVGETLVGYIELGMEIEHLTRLIKQTLNLELMILIEKKHLDKADWEAGLKILNRTGNWELFQDFAIIDRTMEGSAILDEKLRVHFNDGSTVFSANLSGRYYIGHFKDLIDASGRRVGEIVILMNITPHRTNLKKLIFLITGLLIVIGGGLLVVFNTFIGAIQNRLINSQEKLRSEIDIRRKREEELEALLSNSQVGIMVLREGRVFYKGNQRLADILGYATPEEMKGFSMKSLHLTEERFYEFGEKYYSKLRNKEMLQIEYQLKRKDGTPVWCMLSGKALDAEIPADLNKGVVWVIDDISRIKYDEIERNRLIEELHKALAEVKTLNGLLPICSHCKKVRDDKGYWNQIESYIHKHSDAEFSHGICPECAKKYHPDMDIYDENVEVTKD